MSGIAGSFEHGSGVDNLGADPASGPVRRRLGDALRDWSLGFPAHETAPDDWVSAWWARNESAGVHIGRW